MARLTIAHISDLHAGSPYFVPSLLDRVVVEINELDPDVVLCTGDLTEMGFRQDYLDGPGVSGAHRMPADGRHPRQSRRPQRGLRALRGAHRAALDQVLALRRRDDRRRRLQRARPRSRADRAGALPVARRAVLASRRVFASSCCTITCCPIPGTGRERNIVYDAGDLLEVLQACGVNLVLSRSQARALRLAARATVRRQRRHLLVAAPARQHQGLLQHHPRRRRQRARWCASTRSTAPRRLIEFVPSSASFEKYICPAPQEEGR